MAIQDVQGRSVQAVLKASVAVGTLVTTAEALVSAVRQAKGEDAIITGLEGFARPVLDAALEALGPLKDGGLTSEQVDSVRRLVTGARTAADSLGTLPQRLNPDGSDVRSAATLVAELEHIVTAGDRAHGVPVQQVLARLEQMLPQGWVGALPRVAAGDCKPVEVAPIAAHLFENADSLFKEVASDASQTPTQWLYRLLGAALKTHAPDATKAEWSAAIARGFAAVAASSPRTLQSIEASYTKASMRTWAELDPDSLARADVTTVIHPEEIAAVLDDRLSRVRPEGRGALLDRYQAAARNSGIAHEPAAWWAGEIARRT